MGTSEACSLWILSKMVARVVEIIGVPEISLRLAFGGQLLSPGQRHKTLAAVGLEDLSSVTAIRINRPPRIYWQDLHDSGVSSGDHEEDTKLARVLLDSDGTCLHVAVHTNGSRGFHGDHDGIGYDILSGTYEEADDGAAVECQWKVHLSRIFYYSSDAEPRVQRKWETKDPGALGEEWRRIELKMSSDQQWFPES